MPSNGSIHHVKSEDLFNFPDSSAFIEKFGVSSDKYSLEAGSGDLRLVIQGKSSDLESLRQRAIHLLRTNAEDFIDPRGIVLRTGAKLNNSSLAFVYPGFGNLYPNMGKGLLNQFPGLLSRIR